MELTNGIYEYVCSARGTKETSHFVEPMNRNVVSYQSTSYLSMELTNGILLKSKNARSLLQKSLMNVGLFSKATLQLMELTSGRQPVYTSFKVAIHIVILVRIYVYAYMYVCVYTYIHTYMYNIYI